MFPHPYAESGGKMWSEQKNVVFLWLIVGTHHNPDWDNQMILPFE
jgi:hypothetical protein